MMTDPEAVRALDDLDGADPDIAHGEADKILAANASVHVREAYERVKERCAWWATA